MDINSSFMLSKTSLLLYPVRDARRSGTSTRSIVVKKALTWLSIAFVIFFVVSRPDAAAAVVKGIGGGLIMMGNGFGNFFSSLVS